MNRENFIRHLSSLAIGSTIASLPSALLAKSGIRKLTILHTNDQHSRIEPFPMDGGKNQGLGGFAPRAALINHIRSTEKNILLLDSGDMWQGTPYFNLYGGEAEFKLMSSMGYDAATLGNHDFDAGLEGLAKQLHHARFNILSANYDFSDTPLSGMFQPWKVFVRDGLKIGVFGLGIELRGLVPDRLFGNTRYLDPVATANAVASTLRNDEKCQLVICLSHLGYRYNDTTMSDVVLAQQTSGIDLILGGHTHTFFSKPEEHRNKDGRKVLLNQVGWAGIYLGRIDFFFDERSKTAAAEKPLLVRK